jgi:predicted chitinase
MGVSINIDGAISDYKRSGRSTKFENSLRKIFEYAKNDSKVTSISDLAYLLATAKSESDYSLERWEADYLCGKTGVAYNDKPCEKALNYYRSTTGGKKNYYTLGTDKNGLPYFGRGLIQLTGKANYQSYGDLI